MSLAVAVVRFPGTNCESETVRALEETIPGSRVELLDHRHTDLDRFDAVVLPGGFSYGDYLRAGAIAGRAPIGGAVRRFADGGERWSASATASSSSRSSACCPGPWCATAPCAISAATSTCEPPAGRAR